MNTIEIKAKDLDNFEMFCEIAKITYKVDKVYPGEYTVFKLYNGIDVDRIKQIFKHLNK
jgi:hypothetical protein